MNMPSADILVRFWHPEKDLSFLSTLLDMQCTWSWVAGTPRKTPTGEPLDGNYANSYWTTRVEFRVEDGFKIELQSIIKRLQKIKKTLKELKATGGEFEIYFQLPGSVNNGYTIDSSIVKVIGQLGAELSFEVFPKVKNRKEAN